MLIAALEKRSFLPFVALLILVFIFYCADFIFYLEKILLTEERVNEVYDV